MQKSIEVWLYNKCHKIYLSGPFGVFCLYIFLNISYLQERTIETSSLILQWSKRQQRLNLFFTQKRIAVEPEKHEDGLDKDGSEAGEVNSLSQPPELQEPTMMSVVKNSKIIVWPRPFMKWPYLKCHVGQYIMTHLD